MTVVYGSTIRAVGKANFEAAAAQYATVPSQSAGEELQKAAFAYKKAYALQTSEAVSMGPMEWLLMMYKHWENREKKETQS